MNFMYAYLRSLFSFGLLIIALLLLLFLPPLGAQTGMVTLDTSRGSGNDGVDEGPPTWTFYYQLTHGGGTITQWSYQGAEITGASVIFGSSAWTGTWLMGLQTSTQVIFAVENPWTGPGSVDGFTISGTGQGLGNWTVHNSSATVDGALPVELSSLTAQQRGDEVLIRWRTESENSNLGFNVYRISSGKIVKVNPKIIPGHGTAGTPHDYQFLDTFVADEGVLRYFIEDVDFAGNLQHSHAVTVRKPLDRLPVMWGQIKRRF